MQEERAAACCFTLIQSRKFRSAPRPSVVQLCPSMDLIVWATTATAAAASSANHKVNIHRSVSWQTVATVTAGGADDEVPKHAVWSPDGKYWAVATEPASSEDENNSNSSSGSTTISLYNVETLSNHADAPPFFSFQVVKEEEGDESSVLGLSWHHVGRSHPTAWNISEDAVEEQVSWSLQSKYYLDRSSYFLPPTDYRTGGSSADVVDEEGRGVETALPTCQTPLSVLIVSTSSALEYYLHGRYRYLRVPFRRSGAQTQTPQLASSCTVCSMDLQYTLSLLLRGGSNNNQATSASVTLTHIPALYNHRYNLQIMASLQAQIQNHLSALQEAVPQVLNSYKSTLRPLDAKLQPLERLLTNYGVVNEPIGSVLRTFILVGHTSASSDLANAMDQFFTGVQMNDQLLKRMESSLHGALANVETSIRRQIVAPARALVYAVQELTGIQDCTALQEWSDVCLVSSEYLLTQMVEARHRIQELVSWLRSAGAQTKARGTAAGSVQRENAKKRRVSQVILQRLLSYLERGGTKDSVIAQGTPLAERLLGMNITDLLKENPANNNGFLCIDPKQQGDPVSSPRSIQALELAKSTPTMPFAIQAVSKAHHELFFSQDLSDDECYSQAEFVLPNNPLDVATALHTRIGRDPGETVLDENTEEEPSFFAPYGLDKRQVHCRQWGIITQASSSGGSVQLFALPFGFRGPTSESSTRTSGFFDDDEGDDLEHPNVDMPFYLTTKLDLPDNAVVQDLKFYSDDGKSSLSSGTDSGTGKEGRQKLGILVAQSDSLELWLVDYNDSQMTWQQIPATSDCTLLDADQVQTQCTLPLAAKTVSGEGEEEEENLSVMPAQTRIIGPFDDANDSCQLLLSGPRGVGAVSVTSTSQGITSLELLDMEEDEEDDDEEEEFDEEEDEEEA